MNDFITVAECEKLASKIVDDIYTPINRLSVSIFLCGADVNQKDKTRYKLAENFKEWPYSYKYDVIFPEDIFEELLYNSKDIDLLSLENLLAESVDVILIIPESPGSFAELGVFSSNENLRKKIVCVVDAQYKKNKSFINQGPIKLIKNANGKALVYIEPSLIEKYVHRIHTAIGRIKKESTWTKDVTLLQLEAFLLPAIFLLEPVTEEVLISVVGFAIKTKKELVPFASKTALNILIKKKLIEVTTEGYKFTQLGRTQFLNLKNRRGVKTRTETKILDNTRLEILNSRLRQKKLKV